MPAMNKGVGGSRMLFGALLLASSAGTSAAIVQYQVTGEIVKDPASDPIFGSVHANLKFEVRFKVDMSQATLVPAGSKTNLPSFPAVVLPQNGFVLPRAALRSFEFRSPGATAIFSKEDVIADEVTGGVIFLTGTLDRPTGLNIVLANAFSGYLEVGTLECADRCELKDGLVLDRAGPFGTIRQVNVVRE
jgi:hypothetical protein